MFQVLLHGLGYNNLMKRDWRIDALKAWGILLVVVGHTPHDFLPLARWIYSFHMPLFFFISGYLRFGSRDRRPGEFLAAKARSILVPYAAFWLVSMLVFNNIQSLLETGHLAEFGMAQIEGFLLGGHYLAEASNNFMLWYLQTFFIVVCLFELIVRVVPQHGHALLALALALATIPIQELLPGRPALHVNVIAPALVFMIAGFHFHRFKNTELLSRATASVPLAVLLAALGMVASQPIGGNIAEWRSYFYPFIALSSIVGYYNLAKTIEDVFAIRMLGESTLFILGLHAPLLELIKWAYYTAFSLPDDTALRVLVCVVWALVAIALCCLIRHAFYAVIHRLRAITGTNRSPR